MERLPRGASRSQDILKAVNVQCLARQYPQESLAHLLIMLDFSRQINGKRMEAQAKARASPDAVATGFQALEYVRDSLSRARARSLSFDGTV